MCTLIQIVYKYSIRYCLLKHYTILQVVASIFPFVYHPKTHIWHVSIEYTNYQLTYAHCSWKYKNISAKRGRLFAGYRYRAANRVTGSRKSSPNPN